MLPTSGPRYDFAHRIGNTGEEMISARQRSAHGENGAGARCLNVEIFKIEETAGSRLAHSALNLLIGRPDK